jgi:hypothetical protein
MPHSDTATPDVPARTVKLADKKTRLVGIPFTSNLARCGRCGLPLVTYSDSLIVDGPLGRTWDGSIWRVTAERRRQWQELRQAVSTGRATEADRQRLRRGDFFRRGSDWRLHHSPFDEAEDRAQGFNKWLDGNCLYVPTRVECDCGAINKVANEREVPC